MGSFLDKPITEKEVHNGEGNGLSFGVSAMQGWRVTMEVCNFHWNSCEF
jgi:protein phosphatase 1B